MLSFAVTPLVAVCQAILGEMTKLSGDVLLRGSIAYVPQTAYIVNATLKVRQAQCCSSGSWYASLIGAMCVVLV